MTRAVLNSRSNTKRFETKSYILKKVALTYQARSNELCASESQDKTTSLLFSTFAEVLLKKVLRMIANS